jgi:hypothetical protein
MKARKQTKRTPTHPQETTVKKLIFTYLLGGAVLSHAAEPDFYAYYTRLDFTQPPIPEMLGLIPVNAARTFAGGKPDKADETPRPPRQETMRWGPYADLVVNVAEGRRVVFSRATGYLPYLQTAGGKFPFKQLAKCREDLLCLCSYVRLVEDKPERVVVHWRHVPDPASVVMTEEIHEYFIVTPDGKVRREVRIGTERLDDFNDPANVTVQELALSAEGIKELSLVVSKRSRASAPAVSGSQVRDLDGPLPAAWLKLDDGLSPGQDEAIEEVGRTVCAVAGNKTLWKKGVSGAALAFDGYFTKVTLPGERAPTVRDELTLEAWVALGAYPWNDAGIVHRSAGEPISAEDYKHGYRDPYVYRPWKVEGYMLGVDPYGRPIFKVNGKQIGGGVLEHKETVAKGVVLPTYRWTHLAATYGRGRISLYVNGQLRASGEATGPIAVPDCDVLVGMNGDAQRVSDPVSHSKFAADNNMPLVYGIEGLIDEVMIYDRALAADEIRRSFQAFSPPEADLARPDLERRILPGAVDGSPARKFGATCQTLKFHELWDDLWRPGAYRDIVVRFDSVPCSVVFWQGTNFGSGWVTENNKWMSDQSWEIGGPHGCAEHMADKRGRFDHVRLIENTDARVVVHWRYAAFDVGYVFPGMDIWAEEYYTIYPDGVGVRFVEGHDGGWQDTQFLSQPGTTCLDNMELTALSVANLSGKSADLTWALPKHVPGNTLKDACIKRINFKSKWKIFTIYKEGAEIETWGAGEQSKHTPDPFAGPWNHWPVGLNPSDGRFAVSDDRVTHAALGGAKDEGESILYGFTDQPVTNLVALAKSWNHPPAISAAAGCECKGYDRSQRAYVLAATARTVSFSMQGSEDTPVFNPCFVIKRWESDAAARVAIDGKPVQPGKTFRQGIVRDVDGRRSVVIWLELNSISAIGVAIGGD